MKNQIKDQQSNRKPVVCDALVMTNTDLQTLLLACFLVFMGMTLRVYQ